MIAWIRAFLYMIVRWFATPIVADLVTRYPKILTLTISS